MLESGGPQIQYDQCPFQKRTSHRDTHSEDGGRDGRDVVVGGGTEN